MKIIIEAKHNRGAWKVIMHNMIVLAVANHAALVVIKKEGAK